MKEWQYETARDLGLPARERLQSLQRENGLFETVVQFAWWTFISGYLKVYHRLSISGREHLPDKPPFVLVANHSSHLDVLTMAAALRGALRCNLFPIAAGDYWFQRSSTTLFAALFLNALPMWRRNAGRYAMESLRERLVSGHCAYAIFPEGTRSRSGEMAQFKPGIGMLVAGTEIPVVPCGLRGAHKAWGPGHRFPRCRKVSLGIGEPLVFTKTANDRRGWQSVAQKTEDAVKALLRG